MNLHEILTANIIQRYKSKRYYKLAHTFSRLSVGIELVTILQEGQTRQRLKK